MTRFQVNSPNVIHEIIDGEAILVNLENGSYYSIDRLGAVIWDLVEKGMSRDQIFQAMDSRYEGERGEIERSVQALFDELLAEQLILVSDEAPAEGHVPEKNGQKNEVFVAPVLHKYTDMEDLLLLDPIHDVDESGWPNTPENG
jgi:hypothetical protein